MRPNTIFLAGVLGVMGCNGDSNDAVSLDVESWSPGYIAGDATLGVDHLRFESAADGNESLLVTFDFGGLYVEYGANAADNVFWLDGHGGALTAEHVALLQKLGPMIQSRMGADPALRSIAEQMLGGALAHLSEGSVNFAVARRTWNLGSVAPAPDGIAYSTANDGVRCIKPGSTYTVSFDWPGYSYSGAKTVSTDGGKCSRLGYCGDCTFTTGTFALDCFEHDWCLKKAQNLGLPANDANPDDYYCGDEWQEAADDFLLGYNWPYYCRG